MTFTPLQQNTTSTNNSTADSGQSVTASTTLNLTFEDVSVYGSISIMVLTTNSVESLVVQYSTDGTVGNICSDRIFPVAVGTNDYTIPVMGKFLRVQFNNGGTTQTVIIQTTLKVAPVSESESGVSNQASETKQQGSNVFFVDAAVPTGNTTFHQHRAALDVNGAQEWPALIDNSSTGAQVRIPLMANGTNQIYTAFKNNGSTSIRVISMDPNITDTVHYWKNVAVTVNDVVDSTKLVYENLTTGSSFQIGRSLSIVNAGTTVPRFNFSSADYITSWYEGDSTTFDVNNVDFTLAAGEELIAFRETGEWSTTDYINGQLIGFDGGTTLYREYIATGGNRTDVVSSLTGAGCSAFASNGTYWYAGENSSTNIKHYFIESINAGNPSGGTPLITIVAGGTVRMFTIDSNDKMYVIDSSGVLYRYDDATLDPPTLEFERDTQFPPSDTHPGGIAADDKYLYWLDVDDGTVRVNDKNTFESIYVIATGLSIYSIVVDPKTNGVYMGRSTTVIYKLNVADGTFPIYQSGLSTNTNALTVYGDDFYYRGTGSGSVYRVPTDGISSSTSISSLVGEPMTASHQNLVPRDRRFTIKWEET